MATNSNIEWTDATWNPVTGCTRVSAGCDHCYAVKMTHRLESMGVEKYGGLTVLNNRGQRHFSGKVVCHDDALVIPLQWRKQRRVFVNSMSDLLHRDVPFEFIDRVFAVMALCQQHTFQVLTKRPERMAEYLNADDVQHRIARAIDAIEVQRDIVALQERWKPLSGVWLGTSAENQATANERIPNLRDCPAAVRFVSYEPALEAVLFGVPKSAIDWIIVGGESGPGARPFHCEWAESTIASCRAQEIACFVKQLGSNPFRNGRPLLLKHPKGGDLNEWPKHLRVREWPAGLCLRLTDEA